MKLTPGCDSERVPFGLASFSVGGQQLTQRFLLPCLELVPRPRPSQAGWDLGQVQVLDYQGLAIPIPLEVWFVNNAGPPSLSVLPPSTLPL